MWAEGSSLIKSNLLIASSSITLSATSICFYFWCVKNTVTPGTVWCHHCDLCQDASSFFQLFIMGGGLFAFISYDHIVLSISKVFSAYWDVTYILSLSSCHKVMFASFATPWTVACQAPLSMRFLGKNTGAGCHAISFSRGSSQPRDLTYISCIGWRILYCRATREALCEQFYPPLFCNINTRSMWFFQN